MPLYIAKKATSKTDRLNLHGAPEEIRTPGLQVRSLLLYPAELRALREKLCIAIALPCQTLLRKKINFYAAAIIGLPAFDGTMTAQALFPHVLPQPGHSLTAKASRPDVPATAGEPSAPGNARGEAGTRTARVWHLPTAPDQDRPNVFELRGGPSSPPSRTQVTPDKGRMLLTA